MNDERKNDRPRWLNRIVLGIGLASLLSDWSHEIATTIMPAFLATMGAAAAAWLGLIEGVSDGLSSFAKMGSGYYTDQMRRRKPIAVLGYLVTAVGTEGIGLATQAATTSDNFTFATPSSFVSRQRRYVRKFRSQQATSLLAV